MYNRHRKLENQAVIEQSPAYLLLSHGHVKVACPLAKFRQDMSNWSGKEGNRIENITAWWDTQI
jgi:hypothetical protein